MINKRLAKERNLSDETIRHIEFVHEELDKVLKEPYLFVPTPDKVPEYIEYIEYYLQELWGFRQDRDFHSYWFRVKWCTCPKLDNMEKVGSYMGRINMNCPYHGENIATTWDDKRFGENNDR